jgi:hypothetical protein
LRQAVVSGSDDRRRQAESQLMAIRESVAVLPLLRVLGNDEAPLRVLLAQILAGIPGKEATSGLVKQILAEPDEAVRPVVFEKLKERDDPAVVTQLTRALTSSDIQAVNRAAWTLGNLAAVEAVPRLIPALLSFEQRVMLIPKGGALTQQGYASMSGIPFVPLAYNGSNIALQTPPVVSAGAVAYGIVSAPIFATPLGVGNVGAQINNQPEPGVVTFTFRNVEVLAALEKMTGQDFGYDIDSWRNWASRDFNPAPNPTRRVLQP